MQTPLRLFKLYWILDTERICQVEMNEEGISTDPTLPQQRPSVHDLIEGNMLRR
jgi:hypothetical protein